MYPTIFIFLKTEALQGIPWSRLNYTRAAYREQRRYQNYTNEIQMDQYDSLQHFHEKGAPSKKPCRRRTPYPVLWFSKLIKKNIF